MTHESHSRLGTNPVRRNINQKGGSDMSMMKIEVASVKEAKEAVKNIEALGLEIKGPWMAKGEWLRLEGDSIFLDVDGVDIVCDLDIAPELKYTARVGRDFAWVCIKDNEKPKKLRETDGSRIVIEFGEKEKSEAEIEANMTPEQIDLRRGNPYGRGCE